MESFKQDDEVTPVLFRVHKAPKKHGSEVTAVFPTEPADYEGRTMTCYVHIGQHGGCAFAWYRNTRPAKPEEYKDLKRELESEPYGYQLKAHQKITRAHRDEFHAAVRRLRVRS